jgi:DNA repair exonuclease SbcCD ATPase subunit
MTDVLVEYGVLNELNGSLKQIIVELENAEDRADTLEDDIGDPYGHDDLREAAEEFEDGWNDRRKALKEDLMKIQERVEGTGKAWAEWDTEASAELAVEADEADTMPTV